MPRWVDVTQRIVKNIGVEIKRLRVFPPLARTVVGGHEAAEVGGVEAGAEIVEASFGVAFFAGEVGGVGAVVVAAAGDGLTVAEGQASNGFADAPVVAVIRSGSARTFGAEP